MVNMWVIRNIKYGNYYCSKVGNNNHFVTRVEEAKRWHYKADARKFLKDNMNKVDNFELVKVRVNR